MLYGDHSRLTPEAVQNLMEKAHNGLIEGCIYLKIEGTICLVFVMHRGDEIYKHLTYWSENNPRSWFRLYFEELEEGVLGISLHPQNSKSIKRFMRIMSEVHNIYIESPKKIELIYRPLVYLGRDHTYQQIKGLLPETNVKVGFLDARFIKVNREESTAQWRENTAEHIQWLPQRIKRGHSKQIRKFMMKMWNDLRSSNDIDPQTTHIGNPDNDSN